MPAAARHDPPHVQMRVALSRQRRAGVKFDVAWDVALKTVKWPYDTTHRRQWRAALTATREEFRAGYEGTPSPIGYCTEFLAEALKGVEGIDRNEYDLIATA